MAKNQRLASGTVALSTAGGMMLAACSTTPPPTTYEPPPPTDPVPGCYTSAVATADVLIAGAPDVADAISMFPDTTPGCVGAAIGSSTYVRAPSTAAAVAACIDLDPAYDNVLDLAHWTSPTSLVGYYICTPK